MGENNPLAETSQALYLLAATDKPTPKTLEAALQSHLKTLDDKAMASKVYAAIRIWVAGAGGPKREGNRVTDIEKRKIDDYLAKFNFSKFWDRDPLEVQEKGFERLKTRQRSRNTYRHALKHFVTACHSLGWDPRAPKKNEYLRIHHPNGSRVQQSRRRRWQVADKIALTPKESPSHLNDEMTAFQEFCLLKLEMTSGGYCEGFIRRYFGMLYQEGMPLEELSLKKIVPYAKSGQKLTMTEVASGQVFAEHPIVKSAITQGRFFEALAVAKELCREQEAQVVQYVESLIDNFGKYTACQSLGRLIELGWIIRIAKFIYWDEIRDLGQEAIPLLRFLKERQKQLTTRAKREKPRVAYEEKSLGREQLLAFIYKLKKLAVQEKGFDGSHQLALGTRALQMQTFLAVAFFSLLPPRRYRVLWNLEVGRTMRRGLRVDKRFVPQEEMSDSNQAQWYYYLSVEDYKTGKFKGESWTPIPDWRFIDGTTFYDYIDLWLNQLRPQLNPSCPHFFVNTGLTNSISGTRLHYARIYKWVTRATSRHTGIAVPPKEFRKMYVSYVKSLPDITEAELEAIAAAMGHSRQMQEQVYNQLGHDETVSPVIDFQKRINASYLDDIG